MNACTCSLGHLCKQPFYSLLFKNAKVKCLKCKGINGTKEFGGFLPVLLLSLCFVVGGGPLMGWGSLQRPKERPGTAMLEKTKRRGEGRGDCKLLNSLAKVNPSSWRLLLRSHSHTSQISEPAVCGRGGLPVPREKFRSGLWREGRLSRKGVT